MIYVTEYFSPTCVPCKLLKLRLQAMQTAKPDCISVKFVDATTDSEAKELGIQSCPHLIVKDEQGKELLNQHADLSIVQKLEKLMTEGA